MLKAIRLYSIDTIQLALTKSDPPDLLVTAFGTAATTGWSNIALAPLESELSLDGILDLVFVGTPPSGAYLPQIVPAIAHYVWEDAGKVIGVKVHARTNDLARLLGEQGSARRDGLFHVAGAKTLAIGEEHITTLAVGEEHPPGPTTMVFGEEGGTHHLGETPTFFSGEHGPSHPIAEQPSAILGEQAHPPSDPSDPADLGGGNAFGRR